MVAQGAGPGNSGVPREQAPEGRQKHDLARESGSVAPPGLGRLRGLVIPGLSPWATVCRPSGAQYQEFDMRYVHCIILRYPLVGVWTLGLCCVLQAAEPDRQALGQKAHDILKANCYRCHGQEGTVEGGLNYVLDFKTLVTRKKVVPGDAGKSRLF